MKLARYKLEIVDRYAGDGSGEIETHARMRQCDRGDYVKFEDLNRVSMERDALQQRLNAVEEENDRLRRFTVDLRNCDFLGYNPDGSEPVLFEAGTDGLTYIVGIKMDGWCCTGPRMESRS